jgi:hypothetical protein
LNAVIQGLAAAGVWLVTKESATAAGAPAALLGATPPDRAPPSAAEARCQPGGVAMAEGVDGLPGLGAAVARLFPGASVVRCVAIGADTRSTATEKAGGYAAPVRVTLRTPSGVERSLVFRTATPNEFGHDRRSDRAAQMLLAFDTFGEIPGHVRALEVGAIAPDGLRPLSDAGEAYLVTDWADGVAYAEDLRRVARTGLATQSDLERADALAGWLAALHRERLDDPQAWRRALRDVVGSGEGLFGVVDAYPPEAPGAAAGALLDIERRAVEWRWRLRGRHDRLRRIHGDFHPFNLIFGEGAAFTALDASRGCRGEAADDLTALAVNYVFFALDRPASWRGGLGVLWHRFWSRWLDLTGDAEAVAVAAPFLAWRALVVACPRFYPRLAADGRARLLELARTALDRGLDLHLPDGYFP